MTIQHCCANAESSPQNDGTANCLALIRLCSQRNYQRSSRNAILMINTFEHFDNGFTTADSRQLSLRMTRGVDDRRQLPMRSNVVDRSELIDPVHVRTVLWKVSGQHKTPANVQPLAIAECARRPSVINIWLIKQQHSAAPVTSLDANAFSSIVLQLRPYHVPETRFTITRPALT